MLREHTERLNQSTIRAHDGGEDAADPCLYGMGDIINPLGPRKMEVGLTRRRVLEALRLYLIIGLVAASLGVVSIALDTDPTNDPSATERFWLLVFLFLMPGAIWLMLAAILGSITLRVSDGFIEQVLWRRRVLKRQPISALTKITGSGFSAMVLHFRGGKKIALPGIHVVDELQFRIVLDRLRPDLGLLS